MAAEVESRTGLLLWISKPLFILIFSSSRLSVRYLHKAQTSAMLGSIGFLPEIQSHSICYIFMRIPPLPILGTANAVAIFVDSVKAIEFQDPCLAVISPITIY